MTNDEEDARQRSTHIDQILEELRLNTEDLHDLVTRAIQRARQMAADAREERALLAEQASRFAHKRL